MELYIIKAKWRYDDTEHIAGICDKENIERLKEDYKNIYVKVAESITGFEIECFELNKAYA
jgi:hypothetical protein